MPKAQSIPGNWAARWCKHIKSYYVQAYAKVDGKPTSVLLHRIIMNPPQGLVVDHINHDTLNNTMENLRVVTYKENNENLKEQYAPIYSRANRQKIALTSLSKNKPKANNKSGFRHISWDKAANKWRVKIVHNKKTIYFGRFKNLKEAQKMVEQVRKSLLQVLVEQVKS